jgi:FKBP-type peptidyl-prolyl cis-trans isomerase
MTKKPVPPLQRLTPASRVAIGAGIVGVLLTVAIFAPGGFLDMLAGTPHEEESGSLLVEDATLPAELSREKSEEYLITNAKKAGVKVTPSGLQYRELSAGTGKQPGPDSKVTVHYKGTFINGQEFDSSYSRGQPASFGLYQVIQGWKEGLQLMRQGGKAEFVIPQELAYGPGDRGIPPYQTLVFQIELIEVH